MSNGTDQTPSTDYLVSLKDNLTLLDNSLTFKIGHIDIGWTRLLGTTNMQGRYINGVASPCNTSSSSTTGRFLHVEQAYSKLRDNLTSWNKVVNAVAMTIPADNVQTNNKFLEFDGSNDYVHYSNDAVLQKLDGASDYTHEAWLYISEEGDNYDVIINRENSFMIQLREDLRVSFRIRSDATTWAYYNSNDNAITIGQWNHIAVIRDTEPDPNTLKIFVNGIDVSGNTWMGYDMRFDGGDLYIGKRANDTNRLNGFIDEIRIKNNAEYPGNLRSSTSDRPYTWDRNTVALFHFDEDNGFVETDNEAEHWATLGDSDLGASDEPIWRNWDYLLQDLPLPVSLISFNAREVDENVLLKWTTASEVDNYGFEIERVSYGKAGTRSVKDEWITLGFVKGHGNSSSQKDYSFIDESVSPGLYQYRLKQINIDGSFEYSEIIEVQFGLVPTEYVLEQNYPNPFNPLTIITFALPIAESVKIEVYNVIGQKIETLLNKTMKAGIHEFEFNAQHLSSGIYFYRIEAGEFQDVKKMVLLR